MFDGRLSLMRFQSWHGPGYESNDNGDAGLRRRDRNPPRAGDIVVLERGLYRGMAALILFNTPDVWGFWTASVFCDRAPLYQEVRPDDYRVIGHALRTPSGRLKRSGHALLWQPSDGSPVMAGLRKHEAKR